MFSSKLADSDAEATETEVWSDFARDCGYLAPEIHRRLAESYHEIGKMLHAMLADPRKFAPRGAGNRAKPRHERQGVDKQQQVVGMQRSRGEANR